MGHNLLLLLAMFGRGTKSSSTMMTWNRELIPVQTALQIGWNLPIDVVGAGVYGGVVKRDNSGRVVIGDEWPENNRCPPAHNPVHSDGPYLDFSKFTNAGRGYTRVAQIIQSGNVQALEDLFQQAEDSDRAKLANLVMTGGARPLHMCGMGRGGDTSDLIAALVKYGADVNAKDNYEYTPMDRLASNSVRGIQLLQSHGAVQSRRLPGGRPDWDSNEFVYTGPGEV
jgi:hypothetical protein